MIVADRASGLAVIWEQPVIPGRIVDHVRYAEFLGRDQGSTSASAIYY
jgi:hypothetical protein